jgi:hypothetical protein
MKKSSIPWVKLLFALLSLGLLVTLAAKDFAPNTSVAVVLAYAIGGAAAFAVVILLVMWLKFAVNQFLLNAGATDTQWLWFKSDPKGLNALRGRVVSRETTDDD